MTEHDLFEEFTRDENGNVVLSEEEAHSKIKKLGGYDKLYRIKLEADGWTYFLASLQALAPVKLIFSTVLSLIAALAVYNSRMFRQ